VVLDGQSTAEAAELLRIPRNTVKTPAMRAWAQLDRKLATALPAGLVGGIPTREPQTVPMSGSSYGGSPAARGRLPVGTWTSGSV